MSRPLDGGYAPRGDGGEAMRLRGDGGGLP